LRHQALGNSEDNLVFVAELLYESRTMGEINSYKDLIVWQRGSRAERCRLENHKKTSARPASRPAVGLTYLFLASFLAACVSNSFSVRDSVQSRESTSLLASEVILEVEDSGVKWGAGEVGNALKTALVKNCTFGQVHYPIYPTHPVPITLLVSARGDIETDGGEGFAKSFVTGFLFFLPVGVLQYRDTFTISAEVSVLRGGRKFGPLTVESRVAADHTLFSGPESYAARAEQLAIEDLAARLSDALSQHPDWFSP